MAFAEEALAGKNELVKYRITSSTQITTRASAVISSLTQQAKDGQEPVAVCLTAEAKAANKLISIVEIAKRDLASKGVKCFQYNALSSQVVDVLREPKKKTNGGAAVQGESEVQDPEDDFEVMNGSMGTTKKRNMPSLAIYLAAVSVRELRIEYGLVAIL